MTFEKMIPDRRNTDPGCKVIISDQRFTWLDNQFSNSQNVAEITAGNNLQNNRQIELSQKQNSQKTNYKLFHT